MGIFQARFRPTSRGERAEPKEKTMTDTALDTPQTDSAAAVAPGGRSLSISDSAARRVAVLRQMEGDDALMLRVTVSGGG